MRRRRGGDHGSTAGSLSAELADGDARPMMTVSGPYTIEAVTVARGDQARRHALNRTIPAGQTHEVRVGPDDAVEVVAAPK